jgi:hypothetical protein
MCSWLWNGLGFAVWITDADNTDESGDPFVSDTFFAGDNGSGFQISEVEDEDFVILSFYVDNFKNVGRDSTVIFTVNDTLHVRLMYATAAGDTQIAELDTVIPDVTSPGTILFSMDLETPEDCVGCDSTSWPCFIGPCHETDVEEEVVDKPIDFYVEQNSPNPFNSATEIEYGIPEDSDVRVEIFNLAGRKIKTLVDGYQTAGKHTISWDATDTDGRDIPTGSYFYSIEAGDNKEKIRMLYIK